MADIWKKWLKNPGWMRVVLAFLYLFTTFGTPLSHTCQLADKDIHRRYSECTNHRHEGCNLTGLRLASSQSDCDNKNQPHSTYCSACLYSLTAKAFKFCSNASLYSIQAVVRTQILPQLNFTKQLEWFCSAPLRAPPSIAS